MPTFSGNESTFSGKSQETREYLGRNQYEMRERIQEVQVVGYS